MDFCFNIHIVLGLGVFLIIETILLKTLIKTLLLGSERKE